MKYLITKMSNVFRLLIICLLILPNVSCNEIVKFKELEEKYNSQINYQAESIKNRLPFSKGISFNAWLDHTSDNLEFFYATYTDRDFYSVKQLGIEIIRLPVNFHAHSDPSNNYKLDTRLLEILDLAVYLANKYELYLIIDNHSFSSITSTSINIIDYLIPIWTEIATRYKDESDYIIYEILNEPWGEDIRYIWKDYQQSVIDTIRSIDTRHSIVVSGSEYGVYTELHTLKDYDDSNLIYSFHYYNPYMFTHQGETWSYSPILQHLYDLPFPWDAHELPTLRPELHGTWVETSLPYYKDEATIANMEKELDEVVKIANTYNMRIICGEFGAYRKNTLESDRLRYYQVIAKLFDIRGITRLSWDYFNGFGIFKNNSDTSEQDIDYDLDNDIAHALGYNTIPQKKETIINSSLTIFDKYFNNKQVKYYSHKESDTSFSHRIEDDNYALRFGNAYQYYALTFFLFKNMDFNAIVNNGGTLKLRVKSNKTTTFQIRFLTNNLEGKQGIKYRLNYDVNLDKSDNFQEIDIPIIEMINFGSYDTVHNVIIPPLEHYPYSDVDSLQILGENNDLLGVELLFDEISIISNNKGTPGTPGTPSIQNSDNMTKIVVFLVFLIVFSLLTVYLINKPIQKKRHGK